MCGRFTLTLEAAVLQQQLRLIQVPEEWIPRYNISPSQNIAVIRDADEPKLDMLRWGLIPFWAKSVDVGYSMINARAETIAEKPSYKQSFKMRRCLIPADGFYEWKKSPDKKVPSTPFYIKLKSDPLFFFAGIWDAWKQPGTEEIIQSCTIITTSPNSLMTPIHDRMPVIFDKALAWEWLKPNAEADLLGMLNPYDPALMTAYSVSRLVNSPSNDMPACIEPAQSL